MRRKISRMNNDFNPYFALNSASHYRRKFDEALKALPEPNSSASVVAKEGLSFCNQLFTIERDLRDLSKMQRIMSSPIWLEILLEKIKSLIA